ATAGAASSDAQRNLLAVLAAGDSSAVAAAAHAESLSLEALMQRLGDGDAFVAQIDGDTLSALLWITPAGARLLTMPAPEIVREHARALSALLQSPGSPLGSVAAAARSVAEDLFAGLSAQTPPRRLDVLAMTGSAAVPWN